MDGETVVLVCDARGRVTAVESSWPGLAVGVGDDLLGWLPPAAGRRLAFLLGEGQADGAVTLHDVALPVADGLPILADLTWRPGGEAGRHRIEIRAPLTASDDARAARAELASAELASAAKSRFLAAMSHEIRTPLNAIIGFSEVLAGEYMGPAGNEVYPRYARDILDSAHHLLGLVNEILDLGKVEAGHADLMLAEVEALPLVQGALRIILPRAAARQVVLRTALPTPLPGLRVDARRVRQILLNLLTNAVKATPAGGTVTVGVRREEDGGLAVWVSDTGCGMTAEEVARAFQPYARVRPSITSGEEGTGLGLPLSAALALAHGGRLWLDSAPGEGTTAVLALPPACVLPAGA